MYVPIVCMMCKLWSGPGSFTIGPWLILSWGLAWAQGLGSTEFIMEHYAMFFAHGIMFHNECGPWLILGQGSARAQGPGSTKFIMEHYAMFSVCACHNVP